MQNQSFYILDSEEIVAGSNKLMLHLFNAVGSGLTVHVWSLEIMSKSDVAVTGVVSARFDLLRTNSIGTGGVTAGYAENVTTKTQINPFDTKAATLNGLITARSSPAGGANTTAYITKTYAQSEETNASAISNLNQNHLENITRHKSLEVNPGEGLLIRQGSVASLNSYSFRLVFSTGESDN